MKENETASMTLTDLVYETATTLEDELLGKKEFAYYTGNDRDWELLLEEVETFIVEELAASERGTMTVDEAKGIFYRVTASCPVWDRPRN